MKTRIYCTICYVCTFLTGCTLPYLCRGAAEPFPMTPSATSSSTARPDAQPIMESLKEFPKFQDVAYPKLRSDDIGKDQFWARLYNFNNVCMGRVINAVFQVQSVCGSDQFNLVVLAKDEKWRKEIAALAQVDEFYIKLYLSRAIAVHYKSCRTPTDVDTLMTSYKGFWGLKDLIIWKRIVSLENELMKLFLKLHDYATKLAQNEPPYTDLFIGGLGDRDNLCAMQKIQRECLPYKFALLKTRAQNVTYDQLRMMMDQLVFLYADGKLSSDAQQVKSFWEEINKLSEKKQADPYFGKFEISFTFDLRVLLTSCVTQEIARLFSFEIPGLIKQSATPVYIVNADKEEIFDLYDVLVHPNAGTKCWLQHEIWVLEIFQDYYGLSFVKKLPQLCMLIGEVNKMLTGFSLDKSKLSQLNPADKVIETIKARRNFSQKLGQILHVFNQFFDEYIEAYNPVQIPDDQDLNQFFASSANFSHHEPSLFDEFILGLREKQSAQEDGSDQQNVDDLMRTYFPEESAQAKNAHQAQCVKQSKKKHRKTPPPQKPPVFSSEEEPDLEKEQSMPVSEESLVVNKIKAIVQNYHWRVTRWRNKKWVKNWALRMAGHDASLAEKYMKSESVIMHTLPPAIDKYLLDEGFRDTWNGDPRYRLPAKIIYEDGTRKYVICGCTLNSAGPEGQIYHRGYERSNRAEIRSKFDIAIPKESSIQGNQDGRFSVASKKKQFKNRSFVVEDNEKYIVFYAPSMNYMFSFSIIRQLRDKEPLRPLKKLTIRKYMVWL